LHDQSWNYQSKLGGADRYSGGVTVRTHERRTRARGRQRAGQASSGATVDQHDPVPADSGCRQLIDPASAELTPTRSPTVYLMRIGIAPP
jgi:hypothetical protein